MKKNKTIPQEIIRGMRKAIVEFDLIEEGDHILVGLSGGKDSSLMLLALSEVVRHLPYPVELAGMHIDLGFKPQDAVDYGALEKLCNEAEVPFLMMRQEMSDDILHNPSQSPCARCAYWRRGLIHNYAREKGFNKVAFAHHLDDAVETFLMGLLYSGQLGTFAPRTFLDRTEITVVRPMVYLREKQIRGAVNKLNLELMPSPCPLDGFTKRTFVKELIQDLCKDNPLVFDHLVSAMREGKNLQLWPPVMDRKLQREKNLRFWRR